MGAPCALFIPRDAFLWCVCVRVRAWPPDSDWGKWTLLNGNASWVPRTFHTLTFHAGSVWLIGGYDANYDFYADVWRSGDGAEWEMQMVAPWQARAGHGSASVNVRQCRLCRV